MLSLDGASRTMISAQWRELKNVPALKFVVSRGRWVLTHFIFGGAGLVGQHLVSELLSAGKDVTIVDRQKIPNPLHRHCRHIAMDIRDEAQVKTIEMNVDDIVYNVAGTMPSPRLRRKARYDLCRPANHKGTRNILRAMDKGGAHRLVQFSADMVYGRTRRAIQSENDPVWPLGEFGASNWIAEQECEIWRERGMNITIFRPRSIISSHRFEPLKPLFRLIDVNLPIPIVGLAQGSFQFVAAEDCAQASVLAFRAGCPNEVFNLCSERTHSVHHVLRGLIDHAGSASVLVPLPGFMLKKVLGIFELINRPLMQPEHYLSAGDRVNRSINKAQRILGFTPRYDDMDILLGAYAGFRASRRELFPAHFPMQPAE